MFSDLIKHLNQLIKVFGFICECEGLAPDIESRIQNWSLKSSDLVNFNAELDRPEKEEVVFLKHIFSESERKVLGTFSH